MDFSREFGLHAEEFCEFYKQHPNIPLKYARSIAAAASSNPRAQTVLSQIPGLVVEVF